ncbi:MAG: hypothetical protein GXY58_16875 [Planctomycetaceae bacterium]|mgnify:FL=1|nr:hypothetical protein [Planctomycetaceae bacterium]
MTEQPASTPQRRVPASDTPKWGWLLAVWMSLVVILRGIVWMTGVPDHDLAEAVEQGAARVEQKSVGEDSPDVIRKAIQLQRDSLRFWTVLHAVGDFVLAPAWLAVRATLVAVSFSGVAAVSGRPVGFPAAMRDCVAWQGVWVLQLLVRVMLMLVLQRSDIDTSIVLLLPSRTYGAWEWVLLQQIDCFAMLGWLGLAWGACQRRQANLLVALLTCLLVAVLEMQVVGGLSLLVNLGMRLTIFPE